VDTSQLDQPRAPIKYLALKFQADPMAPSPARSAARLLATPRPTGPRRCVGSPCPSVSWAASCGGWLGSEPARRPQGRSPAHGVRRPGCAARGLRLAEVWPAAAARRRCAEPHTGLVVSRTRWCRPTRVLPFPPWGSACVCPAGFGWPSAPCLLTPPGHHETLNGRASRQARHPTATPSCARSATSMASTWATSSRRCCCR